MYVEMKFEHDKKEYILRRSIKFKQTPRGREIHTIGNSTIDLFSGDKPFQINNSDINKQEWIDSILPVEASQFFFFDGEEIQRYIDDAESHVQKAIEKVLGIKELLNAEEDLGDILDRFEGEYSKHLRKHARKGKDKDRLDKLQNDLKQTEQDIKTMTTLKNGAEHRLADLEKDLAKYDVIKRFVEARTQAEQQLAGLKKLVNDEEKKLTVNRGNLGLVLLFHLLQLIHKTEEIPSSIEQWESKTIRHMQDKNLTVCICGRPIDATIHRVLDSKVLKIKPSKESTVKRFVEDVLIDSEPATKKAELLSSIEEISNLNLNIDNTKSSIETYKKEIRNHDDVGIKDLDTKHDEVVKDLANYETDLISANKEKGRLENEKNTLESKIASSVANDQLESAKQRRDTCKAVIKCIRQAVERFYEKRKPELEAYISNIFSSLTNNPELYQGVEIARDFRISVMRNDGTKLPSSLYSPSAGSSQMVATSMIGGLNKFATKNAPIVIDTPMGRLDPLHRKNLIHYYSKMGKQVIILYQPSELSDGEIQTISDSLASAWEISSVYKKPDISQLSKKESYI